LVGREFGLVGLGRTMLIVENRDWGVSMEKKANR
jgi:hypothetical protein